jgi:hypothetical protein
MRISMAADCRLRRGRTTARLPSGALPPPGFLPGIGQPPGFLPGTGQPPGFPPCAARAMIGTAPAPPTRPMNTEGHAILGHLDAVAAERALRAADAPLAARVLAVKAWQHLRFQNTYADLLASPRYAAAARFFLEDLYGPGDFTSRDDQFARIVPALVRLFPHDIVVTVLRLAELHALSERLDTAMGRALPPQPTPHATALDTATYTQAWCAVGEPQARERQIGLMLAVGQALERFTRNPVLRHSLRMMRGPARMAGLDALQRFLENGFDTFGAMRGAGHFLDTIAMRERALAAALFGGSAAGLADPGQTP